MIDHVGVLPAAPVLDGCCVDTRSKALGCPRSAKIVKLDVGSLSLAAASGYYTGVFAFALMEFYQFVVSSHCDFVQCSYHLCSTERPCVVDGKPLVKPLVEVGLSLFVSVKVHPFAGERYCSLFAFGGLWFQFPIVASCFRLVALTTTLIAECAVNLFRHCNLLAVLCFFFPIVDIMHEDSLPQAAEEI